MEEMNVIEKDFPLRQTVSGIELPNGLPVSGGIVEMELSFEVWIGKGARSLHEKISITRDGIVVPEQSLNRRDIGVVDVSAQSESAVASEMAMLKRDGGVKLCGCVITAQGRVVKSDALERENPIWFGVDVSWP
jgi:hypothetical protein